MLTKYRGERCYISEKLDGTSATYYLKDNEFGVCSRNLELLEDASNSFWKVAREMKIEEKLRSLAGNYAIQGELIGEGIQGNKLRLKGQMVLFFNAFDIDRFEYLSFHPFDVSSYDQNEPHLFGRFLCYHRRRLVCSCIQGLVLRT
jgi:RNA ligase (TIGR02306 family)